MSFDETVRDEKRTNAMGIIANEMAKFNVNVNTLMENIDKISQTKTSQEKLNNMVWDLAAAYITQHPREATKVITSCMTTK